MSIKLFTLDTPVPHEIIQMPGGEYHTTADAGGHYKDIKCMLDIRGALPDDLISMLIMADAIHRDGGVVSAYIPYLPGARQDRRKPGEALSSKVYADLINSCGFKRVFCVDPHSDVMPALINNCVVHSIYSVINVPHNEFVGIIAPDAGAAKRANEAAMLYQLPVYQALKKRDSATGRLSNFTCETLPSEGKLLVVDDICDGGGTFLGLAKATGLPKERLALWVTHGIFSGQAANLKNFYSAIYTTNSHPGKIDVTYDHEFMKILTRHELRFNMIGNS